MAFQYSVPKVESAMDLPDNRSFASERVQCSSSGFMKLIVVLSFSEEFKTKSTRCFL